MPRAFNGRFGDLARAYPGAQLVTPAEGPPAGLSWRHAASCFRGRGMARIGRVFSAIAEALGGGGIDSIDLPDRLIFDLDPATDVPFAGGRCGVAE